VSWWGAAGALGLLLVVDLIYLFWYFRWEHARTAGMAYYGLPLPERQALKRRIRLISLPAKPVLYLIAALTRRGLKMPGFEFEGVAGPPKASSPEVFAAAKHYHPQPQDVFVATQMRCGTTWMQQVVYEIVHRGSGSLAATGQHLYAVSPWIDAVNSVSMADAPIVGDRPARIIKTHLPVTLCPYDSQARYIYVARHPVSCFASIVDFNRSMAGPVLPPLDTMLSWYCSDQMYWLPWPRHVEGWWEWSESRDNVLFVHFEEMKRDLGGVVDRVAAFLGCALTPDERARVIEKSSFAYMKAHEDVFEMAPPTMFSVAGGEFMASGKEKRHEDVTPAARDRILEYCRHGLNGGHYPAARFYPELSGK
jgi:hypothetical protein